MIEVISFTLGYSSRRRTASIGFTWNTTSAICQTGTQAAVSHSIYNKLPFVATRAPESRGSRMNSGIGISLLTGVMNPKISLSQLSVERSVSCSAHKINQVQENTQTKQQLLHKARTTETEKRLEKNNMTKNEWVNHIYVGWCVICDVMMLQIWCVYHADWSWTTAPCGAGLERQTVGALALVSDTSSDGRDEIG